MICGNVFRGDPRYVLRAHTLRIVVSSLLVASALSACAGEPAADVPVEGDVRPMPPDIGVSVAIAESFGFLQQAFVIGHVNGYVRGFADSARLYVPGFEPMVGRAAIADSYGAEGPNLGIKQIRRYSDGFVVNGREVADSGRYEFVVDGPIPVSALKATGRYWTRWQFTEAGQWLVLFDSIAGDQ